MSSRQCKGSIARRVKGCYVSPEKTPSVRVEKIAPFLEVTAAAAAATGEEGEGVFVRLQEPRGRFALKS